MLFDTVKRLAEERGETIASLERKAGMSGGAIVKWKTRYPRVDNLIAVAKVLNVSVDDLFKEQTKNNQVN